MRAHQHVWTEAGGWVWTQGGEGAQLVLVFGAPNALLKERLEAVMARHPRALLVSASTAGEIAGVRVLDDALVATAITFDRTEVRGIEVELEPADRGERAGRTLARDLGDPRLRHVIVLSDGLAVNGSDLVRGLTQELPAGVTVTGGLAGDANRFERTLVGLGVRPAQRRVAAVGLYGSHLTVGCGSLGGWDAFGPDRLVTASCDNVLLELDGEPALALYKRYLGPHASGLPGSALRFPLSLRTDAGDSGVVRTVLGVREEDSSIVFAGDIPEGTHVRLMRANYDRLVDGAIGAAQAAGIGRAPELALLISCVGRRLVLGQRIEEEVEGVREVLGAEVPLAGFYSYGEISPFSASAHCELHNQTMTVTTFCEEAE